MNEHSQAAGILMVGFALVISCSWLGQSVSSVVGLPSELWQGAIFGVGLVVALAGLYMLVHVVRRR